MKKQFGEYFLGLDLGTDSVGWSVTDENYNLCKLNGKALWGVRLFDGGNTAAERRLFRTSRRRNDRRAERIALLEELFASEIAKIDPAFFIRLKESKFHLDDKKVSQKYTLFNDDSYTDKTYFKEFPTIYHLREKLISAPDCFDIRLVYLAIAHIIKNRGHFLLEGADIGGDSSLGTAFENMNLLLEDTFDFRLDCHNIAELETVLKSKGINVKRKKLVELLNAESPGEKAVAGLLAGASVDVKELFEDTDEEERIKISFTGGAFEEKYDDIEKLLQDKITVIEAIKAVYDWALLADILQGETYISYAKVKVYEKHKKDLALLKKIVKAYCPDQYREIFTDPTLKANYVAYIGKSQTAAKKETICNQEALCKYLEGKLKTIQSDDEGYLYIKNALANRSFLPKQTTKDNGVIPYQVHLKELKAILSNASAHYAFLNAVDESGYTVQGKIEKLLTFRIPYYVGPLNDAHAGVGNCWIVKKTDAKILPWNFEEVVDVNASAETFITRMTNKCTYLTGEDVIPKNSLLYSKYMVLNELNNLRINGEKISVKIKQAIYNNLFAARARVTQKALKNFFRTSHGLDDIEISGIDGDFKATLTSFLNFAKIFPNGFDDDIAEQIIKSIALFGDDKRLLKGRLKALLPKAADDEIKALAHLKYQGWGRLSKALLTDITGVDKETGESFNIITALWHTNKNLMELLSDKFTFKEQIDSINADACGQITSFSYDTLVKELYVSPSVKKSIWQALTISLEIKKVMGHAPKKVFVEVAREPGDKKRTISRRNTLIDFYKKCKDEERDWVSELEAKTDEDLRRNRLYLYYTQMGRCMYCGGRIEIGDLFDANIYDVDHIFPQSRVKDDSLENRVLTHRTCNAKKSDTYPLPEDIRGSRHDFWKTLLAKGLIGKIKYDRLTRNTPFGEDELAGFIARQIVETRQSTKSTAEVLQKMFPETQLVYVKAGNVSDFRKGVKCYPEQPNEEQHKFVKVRELNDLHHAKDAYLNIVVGNVYDAKFTRNPLNFIKSKAAYNMKRMFEFDVSRGGVPAWRAGTEGTMATVKKIMAKNNVLFTRYATEEKGGLFDQMPVKKGKDLMPLKGSDPRLCNTEKYGGYDKIKGAYFVLVEHTVKNENQRTLEYVPVYLAKDIERDNAVLMQYLAEKLHLVQPRILIPKIKINTLFNVDGFLMHLSGRTGERLVFKGANQLCVDEETTSYFKKIVKYVDNCKAKKATLPVYPSDGLTAEANQAVYDLFLDKLKNTVYTIRLSAQVKTLENAKEKFGNLSIGEQCKLLYEITHLFQCNPQSADLTLAGGVGKAGILGLSKNITDIKKINIIHQSPTGIFEKVIDLKKL